MTINIRKLKEEDLDQGYLDALAHLSYIGPISKEKKHSRFNEINGNPNYFICVAEVDGIVVGGATLFIKPRMLDDGDVIGHIEDVAVQKKYEGHGYGQKIVKFLLKIAQERGCSKTILNCSSDLTGWYHDQLGFDKLKTGMRFPPKK